MVSLRRRSGVFRSRDFPCGDVPPRPRACKTVSSTLSFEQTQGAPGRVAWASAGEGRSLRPPIHLDRLAANITAPCSADECAKHRAENEHRKRECEFHYASPCFDIS